MRLLRIPLIILALVGLIALAGCGGDDSTDSTASNEEYAQQLDTVMREFVADFGEASTEISASKSKPEIEASVGNAEDVIQDTIDDLSDLEPPPDAQEGHDQLVAAFENLSSKLSDVGDAAESGSKKDLQNAAAAFQEAVVTFQSELSQAGESLESAGITVGGSSTDSTEATTG